MIYRCTSCECVWRDSERTDAGMRRALADEFGCTPAEVSQQDVDMALDECPSCGRGLYVEELAWNAE